MRPQVLSSQQNNYLSFSSFLKSHFGAKVYKIPLNAGFSCPNRDGKLGVGGCIYCDHAGSGTGAVSSIREQMLSGMAWARLRRKASYFIAYFQSYSNTYAPLSVLEKIYSEALVGPEVVGVAIGTRPDCVNAEILCLIDRVFQGRMIWMEYGLQSASDKTLKLINRHHKSEDFAVAARLSASMGFRVCAHVIFGLPGEGDEEMLDTIRFLAGLPVHGVKFHQLYVVKDTPMYRLYKHGDYTPLSQEKYAALVANAISMLSPDVVIQRLVGDPPDNGLVAPLWSTCKGDTVRLIEKMLLEKQTVSAL